MHRGLETRAGSQAGTISGPERCIPPAGMITRLLEDAGYTVVRGSVDVLVYMKPGDRDGVVVSLEPPHAIIGPGAGGRYRVFTGSRTLLPRRFRACILSSGLDRVLGVGVVDDGWLTLERGEASLWSIASPPEEVYRVVEGVKSILELGPGRVVLVRWFSSPNPCRSIRLMASLPLIEMLPGGGCGLPKSSS